MNAFGQADQSKRVTCGRCSESFTVETIEAHLRDEHGLSPDEIKEASAAYTEDTDEEGQ